MVATSQAVTKDEPVAPAAHTVALRKTYGTGQAAVHALAGITVAFLRRSVTELGQSIVMVTHDPRGAAYADRVVFLADGAVVGELRQPTADSVLERMRTLGA